MKRVHIMVTERNGDVKEVFIKDELKKFAEKIDEFYMNHSTGVKIAAGLWFLKKYGDYIRKKDATRVWDPAVGHYWRLTREPNAIEWQQIDRLISHGEPLDKLLKAYKILSR